MAKKEPIISVTVKENINKIHGFLGKIITIITKISIYFIDLFGSILKEIPHWLVGLNPMMHYVALIIFVIFVPIIIYVALSDDSDTGTGHNSKGSTQWSGMSIISRYIPNIKVPHYMKNLMNYTLTPFGKKKLISELPRPLFIQIRRCDNLNSIDEEGKCAKTIL